MNSPTKARVAITLFFFVSGFGFSTWASRIPAIQQKLDLSDAELGSVLFALPLGLMLTLPVTGFLLQRFSSRLIMLTGAVLFNFMLSLIGFATSTWQLVVVLFLFGSSRNFLNISMNAQSIGVQALYNRSIITTFHGIWSIAGFAGAAVGSFMVSTDVPPSYHLLISGILLVILSFFAFPGTLPQPPSQSGGKASFILPDKSLLKFGLISFVSMACEGTMYDWSGIYFQKVVHASKDVVTLGYVVYMVAMAAGRFTGDRLVGRFGVRSMLKYSGIMIFSGLSMAALFPFPLTAGFGFMLIGLGVSCVVPLIFSMAGKSKAMGTGPAVAAISTVGYFGFLLVPPLIGYISHTAGLRWAFALMALLGCSISFMITRIRQEE
ncbi:fucose permease [Arcticibacter tournemirensis]|uniref:MFS transporter n=1 Tax=Arcticibacter tournemirensis TaxID=699437 RepID=A0A5M9HGH7_9SPHI|nr:MFS transporter [Arcticibacter tournemirensis]KAA8484408.1 MFS transporter [Arcticibacter tournemirensis]TQM49850.1 fucose permease [Arcticibacter tournemirensis]